jgi:hypothetical protein
VPAGIESVITENRMRVLTELHRDSSYLIMGMVLGWLGLTEGKPQVGSVWIWGVAFGSAASHPGTGDLVLGGVQ